MDLIRICNQASDKETGGILVGRYSKDLKTAVVSQLTGPPADSQGFLSSFRRGVAGLQSLLDQYWSGSSSTYYLGEWHYHPSHNASPSTVDIAQMKAIANDSNYFCPEPILLIVAKSDSGGFAYSANVFFRSGGYLSLQQKETVL
ncbi:MULTISPECIES: Mov34/MPN/PAD-1 family protein [Pirellulaceae]|nr:MULTISPECIES: Mov34/MPN/PAD-1 family protein [Pirellulaceae]